MTRGQHDAGDGSFGRSAGAALARGIGLIVVAVLLGVVLLAATDDPEPFVAETADDADEAPLGTTPDGGLGGDTTSTTAPAAPRDPSEVTVLVANGSGVRGAAGRVSDTLKASNYVTLQPANTASPVETSVVYYVPGYEAEARAVASLLTPPPAVEPMPEQPPVPDLGGANVLVVVAADLAGAG